MFTEILIPQYVTDVLTNFDNDCMLYLKGEENFGTGEIYYKINNTKGEMTFLNGNIYQGELLFGTMNGKGELVFADGTSYKGDFTHNHMEGEGVITYTNGNVYTGQMKRGKRHGKGKMVSPKLGFEYEGDWLEGKMTGQAVIKYSDGSIYKGGVLRGKRHGQGRIEYPDGNFYEGNWKENKKSGYGVTVWKQHDEEYKGEWSNDLPHGKGTYLWTKQNRSLNVLSNRYVGQFSKGKRHGVGTFYYVDGSLYQGEWLENKKSGFAIVLKDNGVREAAVYKNDRISFRLEQEMMNSVLFHSYWKPKNDEKHNDSGIAIDELSLAESMKEQEAPHQTGRFGREITRYTDINFTLGKPPRNERNGNNGRLNTSMSRQVSQRNVRNQNGSGNGNAETSSRKNTNNSRNGRRASTARRNQIARSRRGGNQQNNANNQNNSRQLPLPLPQASRTGIRFNRGNNNARASNHAQQSRNNTRGTEEMTSAKKKMYETFGDFRKKTGSMQLSPHGFAGSGGLDIDYQDSSTTMAFIQPNPYFQLVDFSDIFEGIEDPKRKTRIMKEMYKVLLRNHSEAKRIYEFYNKKYLPLSDKEGDCLRLKGFWRLLEDIRFQDGGIWLPELHRNLHHRRREKLDINADVDCLKERIKMLRRIHHDREEEAENGSKKSLNLTPIIGKPPKFLEVGGNFQDTEPKKCPSERVINSHQKPEEQQMSESEKWRANHANGNFPERMANLIDGDERNKEKGAQGDGGVPVNVFLKKSVKVKGLAGASQAQIEALLDMSKGDTISVESMYKARELKLEDFPNLILFMKENPTLTHGPSTRDSVIHNPKSPVLFRDFVEMLVRGIILKTGTIGRSTAKHYQRLIKEHIMLIIQGRKTPKSLVPEGQSVLEKVKNEVDGDVTKSMLTKLHTLLKRDPPKQSRMVRRGLEDFTTVLELKHLLEQSNFNLSKEENFLLFMNCVELKMDPERSYKRVHRRKERVKPKQMFKYYNYAGKELKKKLDVRLMDHQIDDIVVVFLAKYNNLFCKDKKFVRKLTRIFKNFERVMKYQRVMRKVRPPRTFPMSQKDFDVQNIQEIKRKMKEKERLRRKRKREKYEERKERIMMKLEDYDIILSDSDPEEEQQNDSDDFTLQESIGGESFYKYTESAKNKYANQKSIMRSMSNL